MINKDTYKRLTRVHIAKDSDGSGFETGTKWVEELSQDEDILHRLVELEDKIEKGTLPELPCKVGDKIWRINWWIDEFCLTPRIEEYYVATIVIAGNNKIYLGVEDKFISFKADEVYFTEDQAKAKLKELQENK